MTGRKSITGLSREPTEAQRAANLRVAHTIAATIFDRTKTSDGRSLKRDPIFAAIDKHKRAQARADAPGLSERVFNSRVDNAHHLAVALATTRPTTAAGLIAWLDYISAQEKAQIIDIGAGGYLLAFLSTIRAGCNALVKVGAQ